MDRHTICPPLMRTCCGPMGERLTNSVLRLGLERECGTWNMCERSKKTLLWVPLPISPLSFEPQSNPHPLRVESYFSSFSCKGLAIKGYPHFRNSRFGGKKEKKVKERKRGGEGEEFPARMYDFSSGSPRGG